MLRSLLAEADAPGAGLITWRCDSDHWYCFASSVAVPHVARGGTGVIALSRLVAFMRGES